MSRERAKLLRLLCSSNKLIKRLCACICCKYIFLLIAVTHLFLDAVSIHGGVMCLEESGYRKENPRYSVWEKMTCWMFVPLFHLCKVWIVPEKKSPYVLNGHIYCLPLAESHHCVIWVHACPLSITQLITFFENKRKKMKNTSRWITEKIYIPEVWISL